MKFGETTNLSITRATKKRLEKLRKETTDDEGKPYENWDDMLNDFIDIVEEYLESKEEE